jgi:hypothetical protein
MDIITAKYFNARFATIQDAQFLVDLRLSRGKFLHKTSRDLLVQIDYLNRSVYLQQIREEAYLIIESKECVPIGCFRLTELSSTEGMNYQSLIITGGQSPNIAVNVSFCVFQLAFEWLKKTTVGPFYVINGNDRVAALFELMRITERGESKFEQGNEYLMFKATRMTYLAREAFYKTMGFGILNLSDELLRICRYPVNK